MINFETVIFSCTKSDNIGSFLRVGDSILLSVDVTNIEFHINGRGSNGLEGELASIYAYLHGDTIDRGQSSTILDIYSWDNRPTDTAKFYRLCEKIRQAHEIVRLNGVQL